MHHFLIQRHSLSSRQNQMKAWDHAQIDVDGHQCGTSSILRKATAFVPQVVDPHRNVLGGDVAIAKSIRRLAIAAGGSKRGRIGEARHSRSRLCRRRDHGRLPHAPRHLIVGSKIWAEDGKRYGWIKGMPGGRSPVGSGFSAESPSRARSAWRPSSLPQISSPGLTTVTTTTWACRSAVAVSCFVRRPLDDVSQSELIVLVGVAVS